MKIDNRFLLLIVLFIMSCSSNSLNSGKHLNDFMTEGFLGHHHFQVRIKGFPGKSCKGLVESRESALEDAKSKIDNGYIKGLLDHYIKIRSEKNIIPKADINNKIEEVLRDKLLCYKKYGCIAFVYYNEDNSAVIVYRISKGNLRYEVENLKVNY